MPFSVNTDIINAKVNAVNSVSDDVSNLETLRTIVDNQLTASIKSAMSDESAKGVPLRLLVSEEFKARLKAQAGRMSKTMGEVIEIIATEPLRKLELEWVQNAQTMQAANMKELVRGRYFDLMNCGKLGHQRLKELSFGQSPTKKERQIIAQVLEMDEEDLPKE